MRLPSRSAAINSRSLHGLSSGPETIFASAAFHCAKSSSTSALLSRLSQKRIGPMLPQASRKERLVINSLQFSLEMPAMPPWSSPQSKVKPSVLRSEEHTSELQSLRHLV